MTNQSDEQEVVDEGGEPSIEELQMTVSLLQDQLTETSGCDYGGGCWVDLWGTKADANGVKHAVKINMTSHARTPGGALINLMAGIQLAGERYKLSTINPNEKGAPGAAASATPAAARPPVAPTAPGAVPTAPVYVPVQPTAPAAAPAETSAGGVIDATKFSVTPRTDGKVDVKFFGAGDQFPRLTMTKLPTACAEMFATGTGAAWTPANFGAIGEYNVPLRVTWTPSTKMNTQGVPYKNVARIEAA